MDCMDDGCVCQNRMNDEEVMRKVYMRYISGSDQIQCKFGKYRKRRNQKAACWRNVSVL